MSCWMMNNDSIASVSAFLADVLNQGYFRFGFEAPRSLAVALADEKNSINNFSEEKIFHRLYQLNKNAVVGRYGDDSEMVAEGDEWPKKFSHQLSDAQMLKRLDCFLYQCDEDANFGNELLKAINDFDMVFAGHIARNNKDYDDAIWG